MLSGTRKAQLTERASVHLDMARGLAALAVLVGHLRALFFIPYHELSHHSLLLDVFYGATTLGHQTVMVFFVLSGFLIVSSILSSFERDRWSWTIYLVNRSVRLSLVLIPALILCWIVDHIGMALSGTAWLYHRPVPNLFTTSVAHTETFRNFIGNLFYLQSILVQPFGSDSPLWSLSYEFWYYILFPVALCAVAGKLRGWKRSAYFGFGLMVLFFVGRTITLYFLIWLCGGLVAALSLRRHARARVAWANAMGLVSLIFVLGFSVSRPLDSNFLTDFIVALGFAVWIYWLVGMPERKPSPFYAKTARQLAGFSYTLYLVHFPVLFFIRARIGCQDIWQPDSTHIFYSIVMAIVAIAIAYGIAQGTEAKTAIVRHKVMGMFQ